MNPITRKSSQDVFDCVNASVALSKGRRAIVFHHIFHARFNLGLTLQIHSTKSDTRVGWRRQKGHGHLIAAVQADARKRGRPIECLLRQHLRIKQGTACLGKRSRGTDFVILVEGSRGRGPGECHGELAQETTDYRTAASFSIL